MKRWDWTWEEPRSTALPERERVTDAPDPAASARAGPPRTRAQAFRRRRAGAVLVARGPDRAADRRRRHRSGGQQATPSAAAGARGQRVTTVPRS